MPPRWLLPKTRVSDDVNRDPIFQPNTTETTQTPKWGEFRFVEDAIPPIKDSQEEERPRTSTGVSERDASNLGTELQIGLTSVRPNTSEGRPPSTMSASYSPSRLDEGMIGVAFGSPTHPPARIFGTLNDLAPTSNYEESVFEQAEPMYQIKGRTSRWKKLGSLFKGGRAGADKDDMFEVPFYKVRVEDDLAESEVMLQGQAIEELPARKSPTPPPKDNPRRSIDERLAQARLEVAKLEKAVAEAEKRGAEQTKGYPRDESRPKLDLVIPDIKMDRYSVMFAGLQEIPPHSKLLARRSRKLDRLKPISTENMKQIDEVNTPDTSTLSPRLALPRRATSPSATKPTAGFSLFPAAALTPSHITRHALATQLPRPQLRRSFTSPARLSPRAEKTEAEITQAAPPPRTEGENAVISPGDTTASSEREAPWSAEACLSPASTSSTVDEDALLELRQDKDEKIEVARTAPNQALNASEAQHAQFLASPTLPQDLGETPEATTPVATTDSLHSGDYKIRRVASSVFDLAIAEIEAFGVPSLRDQPPLPSPPSAYVPLLLAPDDMKPAHQGSDSSPPLISKSRFMMMNMPSPIREAAEEGPIPAPAGGEVDPDTFALSRLPEPQRPPPPTPDDVDVLKQEMQAATPSPMPQLPAGLKISPKKRIAQPKSVPRRGERDVHTSPAKPKQESQLPPKQDIQASPSKAMSNARQRTGDKAERVLGEMLPVSQFQMHTIVGRPVDAPSSPTDSPPAVPAKDSKFVLPLSRWAVKGTAAEVTHKSGLKASPRVIPPAKPIRSITEPLTMMHMNTAHPKSKPPRLAQSMSDEALRRDATNVAANEPATSNLEGMGMERPSVVSATAVTRAPSMPVSGEVGVAQTVSLSRKTSQRILVKRTDSKRDPSPEKKEERAKKLQARRENQVKVLRPPRSSSRPKGPMNLKRSESFKRAIEVGMDDDEEGDMRSGELRARAMSPEMRRVTAGLMVNGHKVMKSSVGVIEQA